MNKTGEMNYKAEKKQILFFIFITYLLTWSVEIPAALSSHGLSNIKISKGLQTLSTLSPGIAAIILTLFLSEKNSFKLLLKSLIKWKIPIKCYGFSLLIPLFISGISLLIFCGITKENIHVDEPYTIFFYLLLFLFFSPFWEEIGWRGYLLPKMQKHFSPLKASLIIGFIWGLWHLPIYMALNPYGDKTIIFFLFIFIGCFPLSIIQTWLYNSTKSLFACILFHDGVNTAVSYFYANLAFKEMRPFEIFVTFFICVAIGIVLKTKGTLKPIKEKSILAA